jgi:hypothetical protein
MILVLFFQGYYGKYPFNSQHKKEAKKDDMTLPGSLSSFFQFFPYILQSGLPCLSEETILLRLKGVKTYDRNVILEFVSYNVGIIRYACNKRIHTQSY